MSIEQQRYLHGMMRRRRAGLLVSFCLRSLTLLDAEDIERLEQAIADRLGDQPKHVRFVGQKSGAEWSALRAVTNN
jgi:hypothetical protein